MNMWRVLEADSLFQHPRSTLSVDEQRHLATRQMYRVKRYNFLPFEKVAEDIRRVSKSAHMSCTGLQQVELHHIYCCSSH
jgi:hypothetical protein